MKATLTSKGQLTVPKSVQNEMGLVPGDKVEFTPLADGGYALYKRNGRFEDLVGMLSQYAADKPVGRAEIDAAIDEAMDEKWKRGLASE